MFYINIYSELKPFARVQSICTVQFALMQIARAVRVFCSNLLCLSICHPVCVRAELLTEAGGRRHRDQAVQLVT